MSEFNSIQKLNKDVNIISKLSNRPTQTEPDNLSPDEFKAKFDEAANMIKEFINDRLVPSIVAANIPFASTSGNVGGETVSAALEQLKKDIAEATVGQIADKTITQDKLVDDLQKLLESGIPVISSEEPSGDYPVGQLWLRMNDGAAEELYIRLESDEWYSFSHRVLPVSRGGTGLMKHEKGAMLYGNGTGLDKLEAPAEDSFLHYGEKPEWKTEDEVKDGLGILKEAAGSYTGNPTEGYTVSLTDAEGNAIAPKFIWIYQSEGVCNWNYDSSLEMSSICLCQEAEKIEYANGTDKCSVKLKDDKLIFTNYTKKTTGGYLMNFSDVSYKWYALY